MLYPGAVLALLPRTEGAPSLEVPKALDGISGQPELGGGGDT